MVAILGELKGRVLIQFPGQVAVEVGTITIPITATVTPEPIPRGSVFEAKEARPEGCCGVCPPIVGGGHDCTCEGNPRCKGNPLAEDDEDGKGSE